MLGDRQKNLLALALGLVSAFVLAEGTLRVYQLVARGVPFFSLLPGYQPGRRFPVSPFLVFGPHTDRQLEDKHSPETSYWSFQGFRTRDTLGAKPAGEYRIFALGGSTTADLTNEAGLHWPLVAERSLHAAGRRHVRIYNAAMSAWSSAHSLVRLEFDLPQYQPDMILVMHNINDLSVTYYAWRDGKPVDANYLVKYGRRSLTGVITERDIVVSRVWHSVRERVRDLLHRPPGPSTRPYDIGPGLALFRRNLAHVVAIARSDRIAVALLTMPMCDAPVMYERMRRAGGEPEIYPDFTRFTADFEAFNQAIRELGRELGVPVLDMRQAMPGDTAYFLDTVHHSSEGVRVLGAGVAAGLLPLLPRSAER